MENQIQPIISIIIPVYNVEPYIRKCILSVQKQIFENFEAIIVNDGTEDQSIEMIQDIVRDDHRFIIIHQENQGLGEARNTGLNHAKGEYLCFLDSDDFLDIHFLEYLHEKITKENADICACSIAFCNQNGAISEMYKIPFVQSWQEALSLSFQDIYLPAVWNKIYKREVFQNIRYPNILHEDNAILVSLLVGKQICSVDLPLYFYFHPRTNSIMYKLVTEKKIKDIFTMLEMMKQQLIQNNIWIRYKDEFSMYYIFISWHRANIMITESIDFRKCKRAFYRYLDRSIYNIKNIRYIKSLQYKNPRLNHLRVPYWLSILLCFRGIGILVYRIFIFTPSIKSIFYTKLNSVKASFSLYFPFASRILRPFYKLFAFSIKLILKLLLQGPLGAYAFMRDRLHEKPNRIKAYFIFHFLFASRMLRPFYKLFAFSIKLILKLLLYGPLGAYTFTRDRLRGE